MKRQLGGVLVAGLALVITTAAHAQSATFGIGGGVVSPTSDYKNADNVGWHALGIVNVKVPMSPVDVRVDGLYGLTTHKDIAGSPVDGNTKLFGGLASVVWKIETALPLVKPYVLAGGGMYHFKQTFPGTTGPSEVSETKFTWAAGGGAALGVGPVRAFVEARYARIQTSGTATKFIPVTAGVLFGSP
ncbi:MAG TPA: outer membrane beta-barrel protein [Gemmatimonadales bacterium]|nr:outer membrane beta-barrel protein [Gemmatimonadales bacterium]